jgi:hypothetical protein
MRRRKNLFMNKLTKAFLRIMLFFGLLFFLTACPNSEPSVVKPNPGEYPVKIPETTKVSDEVTRNALTSFDIGSGVMQFNQSTPMLEGTGTMDLIYIDGEPAPITPPITVEIE